MDPSPEEAARLSALTRCRILDTGAEESFDELAQLAAHLTACPMAVVGFVDRDRVWMKSAVGLACRELPRASSPCDAVLAAGLLAVHDAARDSRFAAHPLVTDAPQVRFYAGARLSSPDGAPIGVLSVLDAAPREISEAQLHALAAVARAVDAQVELRLLRDARLLKSEALLSSAQRISGIGCWEWDMRSQQITWSDEMYAIFAQPRDHIPTLENFLDRIHPDDRGVMQERISDALTHGRTRYPEYRIVWPDGSTRTVAATAELQRDADGRPLRLTGALQDITEQRRLELERQQLTHQVLRTQKLEGLGVLAAGIAHDFNNLLVGMLGNAELANQDAALSPQTRSLIEQVIDAASQAAGLTRQLLAYTGKRPFSMRSIDLSAHVSSLSALLRASLPKGHRLCLSLGPALPQVCADLDQLQQVTMNLILNAAEAYGDGDGDVHVRTFVAQLEGPASHAFTFPRPPAAGRYVVLEVADAGSGMEARMLERIFEPFFSTKFTGRGLGLSAVLGIVRGHDAILCVDSAPNQGTTFRIYFSPVETAQEAEEASEPEPPADLPPNLGVLVVDDEARVRTMLRAVLEGAQARVLEAENGERALALFERCASDIDAVVLDVIMPGPDAPSVVRRLRAIRPSLPIILCSGYPEDDAIRLIRELNKSSSVFLEKPFSPMQLLRALRRLAGASSGMGEAGKPTRS